MSLKIDFISSPRNPAQNMSDEVPEVRKLRVRIVGGRSASVCNLLVHLWMLAERHVEIRRASNHIFE